MKAFVICSLVALASAQAPPGHQAYGDGKALGGEHVNLSVFLKIFRILINDHSSVFMERRKTNTFRWVFWVPKIATHLHSRHTICVTSWQPGIWTAGHNWIWYVNDRWSELYRAQHPSTPFNEDGRRPNNGSYSCHSRSKIELKFQRMALTLRPLDILHTGSKPR